MVNYQACHAAGSKKKKKKSSSPHNAMSCNWLVTGQVSPKGVRAIICV